MMFTHPTLSPVAQKSHEISVTKCPLFQHAHTPQLWQKIIFLSSRYIQHIVLLYLWKFGAILSTRYDVACDRKCLVSMSRFFDMTSRLRLFKTLLRRLFMTSWIFNDVINLKTDISARWVHAKCLKLKITREVIYHLLIILNFRYRWSLVFLICECQA